MDDFGIERTMKLLIMSFSSRLDNIDRAVRYTSDFVMSQNKSIDTYGLKLVLSEAITNAVVHGNQEDEHRDVSIRIVLSKDSIIIQIKDSGPGFDWRKQMVSETADPSATHGRGIELIAMFGYTVSYNSKGNIMQLKKPLEAATATTPDLKETNTQLDSVNDNGEIKQE